MLELETLIAMGLGAALVAVAPVVAAVTGREHRVADAISGAGRSLATQGFKVGIRIADSTSDLARRVGQGLSEAGESLTDLMAEAKADLEQAKATKKA
ncbi:MAG: hypothetical protein ACKOZW_05580 [Cyanobium sp.]